MTDYDLIIIGGGSGGFAAANRANQREKDTLLINDGDDLPLGGTCVNVGCVPSKVLLHQGEEYYYPRHSPFDSFSLDGEGSLTDAIDETNEMVEAFREQNYWNVVGNQEHVDLVEGRAVFVDDHTVEVDGETYSADNILIAAGASTYEPPIDGIADVDYLTNRSVLDLDYEPDAVVVIGGGPLGLEWGQIFHHFEADVTILEHNDRVLKGEDPLVSAEIKEHLENEGIRIRTGVEPRRVEENDGGVTVRYEQDGEEERVTGDELLLAPGIDPNADNLNLEAAGVETQGRGFVEINDRMETSVPHIYAAGDVTGEYPLETVAAKQGSIAVQNMFEDADREMTYDDVPHAVFTSPQVASVGMTEEEYMDEYDTCRCTTVRLEQVEKAEAIKDTRGLIRMVLDHETEEVLGVHIVSPMAADIITTATYAVKNEMTIDEIRDTVHVFPTLSEMIKKAAQSFDADLDDMACCVE
jgi:mercuric reductase